MKLGTGGLAKNAKMTCGDSPFDFFPYRIKACYEIQA